MMCGRVLPVSLSTGSLHTLALDACFGLAAEAGFDAIEVLCDHRPEARDPDGLRRLSQAHRLPIRSLHAPFPRYVSRHWKVGAVASIEHTVRLAEALGAEHVVMHVPRRLALRRIGVGPVAVRVPWRAGYGAAIRRWIRGGGLGRLQARTPVKVCVENLPRLSRWLPFRWITAWNTLAEWPQAHEYLALDTTHWATWGIEPLDAYQAGSHQVRHVHVSNYQAGREHELPQHGDLDLRGFLRRLAADGFDGQVVLELCPESLEAHRPERLQQNLADSLAFCREALRSADRGPRISSLPKGPIPSGG